MAGRIVVSPSTVKTDSVITVTGSGWTSTFGTGVIVGFASLDTPRGTGGFAGQVAQPDSSGAFLLTFQMPNIGSSTIFRVEAFANGDLSLATYVSVNVQFIGATVTAPQLNINPLTVTAGGSITVTGQGFSPNGQVRVWVQISAISNQFIYDTIANSLGIFTVMATIPSGAASGIYLVLAQDFKTLQFSMPIAISINAPPIQHRTVTATMTVTGGFPPPTAIVRLLVDGQVTHTENPAVMLNIPVELSWQVDQGHQVQVAVHLENPLGVIDINSDAVAT